MPESEARISTDGVDCSGATEAEGPLNRLQVLFDELHGLAFGFVELFGEVVDSARLMELTGKARAEFRQIKATADDAGESGVQETEPSQSEKLLAQAYVSMSREGFESGPTIEEARSAINNYFCNKFGFPWMQKFE